MIKSASKLLMSVFSVLVLTLVLISCGNTEQESRLQPEPIRSNTAESFTLTADDMTNQNLALADFEKTQKTAFIFASGLVDLPPENRHNISAITEGFVKEIKLIAGDKVKKGQVLFTLMNPDFLEMQRSLVVAKNSLELAKKEWVRVQSFKEDNIVSTKQYDEARANFFNTEANYSSQKKHLALIGFDIEDVEKGQFTSEVAILSPITGVIAMVDIATGAFVPRSVRIMEVLDLEHFHVELSVFESEAALVEEGQSLWVRKVSAGDQSTQEWMKGYVFRINPSFSGTDKSLNVHAHVEEWENPIIGSYVEAKIQTSSTVLWKVPKDAIIKENNGFTLILAQKLDNTNWKAVRVFFNSDPVTLEDELNYLGISDLDQKYHDYQMVIQN
jgi:cobalt-zinc-cadmium efflux system membrane fusion protein